MATLSFTATYLTLIVCVSAKLIAEKKTPPFLRNGQTTSYIDSAVLTTFSRFLPHAQPTYHHLM